MKKLLCLAALLMIAAAPASARAEGVAVTYHVKKDITQSALAKQQLPGRPAMLETSTRTEEQDIAVTLLPQHLSLRTGDGEKIYNFIEKTYAEVDHAAKTYRLLPLHAIPLANYKLRNTMAQRAADFISRTGTGKMVKTLGGVAFDTSEMMLGLDTLYAAESNQRTTVQLTFKSDANTFMDNGGKAASFARAEAPLPQGLEQAYRRFLVYGPVLHPVVEKELAGKPQLFAELEYRTNNHAGLATVEKWTLSSSETVAADAPRPAVPAGYERRYSENEDVNKAILVAQKPGPTADHFTGRVKEHLEKGDIVRALAAFFEMQLTLPVEGNGGAIDDLTMLMVPAASDSFSQQLMRAMSQKQTTKSGFEFSYKTVLRAKKSLKEDGPDYGYVFDIYAARAMRGLMKLKGEPQPDFRTLAAAQRMNLNTIFTNPWFAAAYADLGTAEHENGDSFFAWVCWEQAARLKPDLGMQDKMDAQRRLAEKEFPEYF